MSTTQTYTHTINEQSYLLAPDPVASFEKEEITGEVIKPVQSGLLITVLNLSLSIIGSGTLAIPFAISRSQGLTQGMVLMCGTAIISFLSSVLLVECSEDGYTDYKTLADRTFGSVGRRLLEVLLVFAIALNLISYQIVLMNCVSGILQTFSPNRDMGWVVLLVVGLWDLLVLFPLSVPNTMRHLSLSSLAGAVAIVILIVILIMAAVDHPIPPFHNKAPPSLQLFLTISIFSFALGLVGSTADMAFLMALPPLYYLSQSKKATKKKTCLKPLRAYCYCALAIGAALCVIGLYSTIRYRNVDG